MSHLRFVIVSTALTLAGAIGLSACWPHDPAPCGAIGIDWCPWQDAPPPHCDYNPWQPGC